MAYKNRGDLLPLWDVHCHMLPGIDDGAGKWERTKEMLAVAYEDGIREIIVTPHFGCHGFMADKSKRVELVEQVNGYLRDVYPDMQMYEGCEIFVAGSGMAEHIYQKRAGTMADSRYILIEFPMDVAVKEIHRRTRELANTGFWPILAHVERYEQVKSVRDVEELASIAYIQVNANSIMGEYGFFTKRLVKKLLKQRLISFVASDAHGINHRPPKLRECYYTICDWCGEDYAEELFSLNPQSIVKNKKIV